MEPLPTPATSVDLVRYYVSGARYIAMGSFGGVSQGVQRVYSSSTKLQPRSVGSIPSDTWYLSVVRGDGTGGVGYDGMKLDSLGETETKNNFEQVWTTESSPNLTIGAASLVGSISHVAMWNTYLSDAQVIELATIAPNAITGYATGLYDYWALTDSSLVGINGKTLIDSGR